VCGCDGNTYPDVQSAWRAGVRVNGFNRGGCSEPTFYGGGGVAGEPVSVISCGSDEQCPADQRCCFVTGICYDPAAVGTCGFPPAGTDFPCSDDRICFYPAGYCQGDGCQGRGGCVNASNGRCGVLLEPVCGCDGKTYTSNDCASGAAVRVAHTGACSDGG
jgi:hypothetical protein